MKSLAEIQAEVGIWSPRNFPANTPLEPLEGILEETGELAHSRVKRRQGIRHTPEECIAMERDAIGDMGIYLCDFASRTDIDLDAELLLAGKRDRQLPAGDASAFALLAFDVGSLAVTYHDCVVEPHDLFYRALLEGDAGDALRTLVRYTELRGWDFAEILDETWSRVGKRNWSADPINAGGVA